jgi:predicted lipid-binding transport protein (Tim44 family)
MAAKRVKALAASVFLVAFWVDGAVAQDVFAYPNQGQSQEQQDKDNYECFAWAKQQSGFDPMKVPVASAPPPQEQSQGPGMLGGAAVGAGAGAIGGAIVGGKAGTGAAIGAATGGLLGGLKSSRTQKNNKQARSNWERQQAAQYQQGRNNYNRAYSACMSGRGYTIN